MYRRTRLGLGHWAVLATAAVVATVGCRADGLISKKDSTMAGGATGSTGNGPAAPPPGGAMAPAGMGPARPAMGVTGAEMPTEVLAVLQGRCAGCHTYGQADPAGWGSVLDVSRMIDADIVVPGDPNASRLIDRVAVAGDMPPKGARLSTEEVGLLRKWIMGLQRPADGKQSETDILDAIARDQLTLRDRSADYRYISFAHFAGE